MSIDLPKHIAIIMDGNGRWARKRGLPRAAGHKAGIDALKGIVQHTLALPIPVLTVFAFSKENWRRPESEVHLLLQLFLLAIESELSHFSDNNVKLNFIGDRDSLPLAVQSKMALAEKKTQNNCALQLNVAFNYSGRWDILQSLKTLLKKGEAITETSLAEHLQMPGHPFPDLVIRSGGEQRISNFLLWDLADTELFFTECLWPDFSKIEMKKAIAQFAIAKQPQSSVEKTPEPAVNA